MRHLTIHIPEGKFQFILELLRKFNFVKIDIGANDDTVITDEQKALVDDEIRKIKENPNYLLNWNDVKNTFKFD